MPPIGTSRGYGAEDENSRPLAGEGANNSPDSGATGGHGSEYAGHGNAGHAGHAWAPLVMSAPVPHRPAAAVGCQASRYPAGARCVAEGDRTTAKGDGRPRAKGGVD